MNKQNQNGSVHIIAISIVVLVILGAVGYLFWQNIVSDHREETNNSEQTVTTKKKQESPKPSNTNTYNFSRFTFDYPSTGWEVKEIYYGDKDEPTVSLRTLDYSQMSMDLDAGAQIGIYVSSATNSLAEMKKEAIDFGGGTQAKDMTDTKVSGIDAFSYNSAYEGPHYYTIFVYNGLSYQIIYQYAGTDAEKYMVGYKTLVDSLKLK